MWQFPHGTGWVPAIVCLAGTQQGQDLLSAHPVSGLTTIPALCESSLGLMAQPSLLWHSLSRSLGWFSQTLPGWQPCLGCCCFLALHFVLGWQGEQHSSQVEAGMSVPPGRDGNRSCSLEWL